MRVSTGFLELTVPREGKIAAAFPATRLIDPRYARTFVTTEPWWGSRFPSSARATSQSSGSPA